MFTMNSEQKLKSIDLEIDELEKLISLQQRKVELLRKKNEISKVIDDNKFGMDDESQLDAIKTGTMHIVNTSDKPALDSDVLLNEKPPHRDVPHNITIHSNHDSLSRMSAILANERTYLAWTTTAMASARTALAFLNLVGVTAFGDVAVYITSIGFAVVGLWMILQGSIRYLRISENLKLPEPTLDFDQVRNLPIHLVIIVLFVILIIANSADSWSK